MFALFWKEGLNPTPSTAVVPAEGTPFANTCNEPVWYLHVIWFQASAVNVADVASATPFPSLLLKWILLLLYVISKGYWASAGTSIGWFDPVDIKAFGWLWAWDVTAGTIVFVVLFEII